MSAINLIVRNRCNVLAYGVGEAVLPFNSQENTMPSLTPALRDEYQRLFDTCEVRDEHSKIVEQLSQKIKVNEPVYERIEIALGIPWYAVGLIHAMETNPPLSMSGHLHNGDPLSTRTVQVPAGRPATGTPPFSWEESAIDALTFERFHQWNDWSIPGLLYKLERYNGWGYRKQHPEVLTPYLWSFTNHYERGKYISDGRFSDTARSKQCGAAALLRRLMERGSVHGEAVEATPLIHFRRGPANHVEALQRFLNTCPGIAVKPDGKPGKRTSAALKAVTGNYLAGDPRAN
jgi:lysozyme family protein